MAKGSLSLVKDLEARGLLTKEAAQAVVVKRERVIRDALYKEAGGFFNTLRGMGEKPKGGGLLSSIASKFSHGGMSPAPEKGGAGWGDVTSNIGKMLALAGLTAGASAGVTGILRHGRDKKLRQDMETSYKKIFEEEPRLQDYPPGRVERHFSILAQFAPSLAADPTVAAAFVNSSLGAGYIDPKTIEGLAAAQNKIDEMHERHSMSGAAPAHLDRGINIATRAMNPFGGGSQKSGG
jgi:hypothetical protein